MTTKKVTSSYEIERNKPLPNRIHGVLQGDLVFFLNLAYRKKYNISSEVSLATTPSSTPDICIFPKKKLDIMEVTARETEAPITIIEIQSPSQSPDELVKKIHQLYFPMGVKSAWLVLPALKAIQIITPKEQLLFSTGKLKDPVTNIELDIQEIFENLK